VAHLLNRAVNPWVPAGAPATRPAFVVVVDIGQGNLNAIFNEQGRPFYYYDLGGGCGQNKFTYAPTPDLICPAIVPRIVLSNWDEDHVVTGSALAYNNGAADGLQNTEWLVREYPNGIYGQIPLGMHDDIDANPALHGRVTHWVAGAAIGNWGHSWLRVFRLIGTSNNEIGVGIRIENPTSPTNS
jgi:hypothetical protein